MLKFVSSLALSFVAIPALGFAASVSLNHAVVVPVGEVGRSAEVLVQEVDKRAQILLPTAASASGKATIVLGTHDAIRKSMPSAVSKLPAIAQGAEGYRIVVTGTADAPMVVLAGNDSLGTLFAVGRLLQELDLRKGSIAVDDQLRVATAPHYRLRGHQLGYRPKTNSYDGWDVAQWDQYIRELALFGTNAIELITPRSDDAPDSPHFPISQKRMLTEMSRITKSYGLQCWLWFPALEKDYTDAATMRNANKEWEEVFQSLPCLDAVFVPGGDPGHTEPGVLMKVLEEKTAVMRKYHPKATMWVSPQGFNKQWMETFYSHLDKQPTWLTGVVFGPQNRERIEEFRRRVPKRYEVRHYPDITHTMRAQYPVPNWDIAFASTLQREPINPRPHDQAVIVRKVQPTMEIGFLTYSEGCNDDVNKFVWSALGWDPNANVTDVIRSYSNVFIGSNMKESFTTGIFGLEANWRGAAASNDGIDATLALFRSLEAKATPAQLSNWRFQQALYRAYYDAYVRVRSLDESAREAEAMQQLRKASSVGSLVSLKAAEDALRIPALRPGAELRARTFELAEALFQSIHMQLSVPRYQAIGVGRGANLDLIDVPLNNAPWLTKQFAEIRELGDEPARLARIQSVVNWTNPGPGGFYDDLGNPLNQPHVVDRANYDEDPMLLNGVSTGYGNGARLSWGRVGETKVDRPLELEYNDLDPKAQYKVRVIYGGDSNTIPIRLDADEKYVVHPPQAKNREFAPVEALVPQAATADGKVRLRFSREAGLGGNGRAVQVAEIWLLRVDN